MRFHALVDEIFDREWFTNDGPLVREFEEQVAEYVGVSHCVAVSNGTIALEITAKALGLSGEVIVPSFSFVATAHALHWQGITPVFADINPVTHNLDPISVRRMITPKTTGIVGVHLWGRPAPVAALQEIADEFGIHLLFDAAHAFGASDHGRMIGSSGRAEVFSFHATKFFNTFEGGAVVTNDPELAHTLRLMRNFGFAGYDNVIHAGTNGKMTEVCAAMGLANFPAIDDVIEMNRRNHAFYTAQLAGVPGIEVLPYDPDELSNFQYAVLLVHPECPVSRDDMVAALHAEGVLARRYFWPGIHRMEPYRSLFPNAGHLLPNTETVADQVVVLPNGSLTASDLDRVCSTIVRGVGR